MLKKLALTLFLYKDYLWNPRNIFPKVSDFTFTVNKPWKMEYCNLIYILFQFLFIDLKLNAQLAGKIYSTNKWQNFNWNFAKVHCSLEQSFDIFKQNIFDPSHKKL